jgi:nucleoside-diphosphate-sugar epimerase
MVSLHKKKRRTPCVIVGCGEVGMRLLPLIRDRYHVYAVTSHAERCAELRAAGATPIVANLDHPSANLARIGRLAKLVIHLAPPQATGEKDLRTRRLSAILPEHATVVYISTTGVYGDCAGAIVSETRPIHPMSERAKRRVDAEQQLRAWAKRRSGKLAILRVPGIYSKTRLPVARLEAGLPALIDAEDVYTNHIHQDDLAAIIVKAIDRALPQRVYHATDGSHLKMGTYFEEVAHYLGLPPPPRLPFEALKQQVTPMMLSFMRESRRLSNARLCNELGVRLQFPTVQKTLSK